MSQSDVSDVVVIGGGVIGLSVAYFCARNGMSVTVLERGQLGRESSWAGAGILSPGRSQQARSAYARLLAKGSEMYPELSEQLRCETGIDNGYRQCGGIELGFDQDDAHALQSAAGHYRAEGIAWEELTVEQTRQLEPALQGNFEVAYHVPEMAQVRNPRHVKALCAACVQLGVRLAPGEPVLGFELRGSRVVGVRTLGGQRSAAATVVTAGAWSGGVLSSLGSTLPVSPVRGQIALLHTDCPQLRRVIMMGKKYLVPRPDGRLLVGSTEERVGFDNRPTAAGIHELLQSAISIAPPLAKAQLERSWAGLRPASVDGKPLIGRLPGYEAILVATGHFRAGLQLSPVTGLVISELVQGQSPSVGLDAFRLDRPSVTEKSSKTL